jgi:Coenzyme PQQ synthesis protein D (PqqD)
MRAVFPHPPGPAADRPERVSGLEVLEAAAGLTVHQAEPSRVHQLNNTAAVVFELCDGRHTVAGIAEAVAEAFALDASPLAEVAACVAELREAGVLAGHARPEDQAGDPFGFFDAIYCLNLDQRPDRWADACRRFCQLGIAARVERFPAVSTPENHHAGCARSWRLMVAAARDRGLGNFLGIEDDAIFLDQTREVLAAGISELAGLPWDLLYLGGATWEPPAGIPGCTALQAPHGLTCTHALAVNRAAYDRLLADIPEAGGIDEWLTVYPAVDQYLADRVNTGYYRAYLLNPRVATQAELTSLAQLDGPLRDRYTIR